MIRIHGHWIILCINGCYRFYELNNGYPDNKTAEEWDKELKHNISLLETLCEDNYEEHYSERQEFNKWLGENINNLWW